MDRERKEVKATRKRKKNGEDMFDQNRTPECKHVWRVTKIMSTKTNNYIAECTRCYTFTE